MSRYAKGVKNEKRSRYLLSQNDYFCIESRGSHGAFDVVGVYLGKNPEQNPIVIFVQSKTNSTFVSDEIKILIPFFETVNKSLGRKIISIEHHNWKSYQRKPSIITLL